MVAITARTLGSPFGTPRRLPKHVALTTAPPRPSHAAVPWAIGDPESATFVSRFTEYPGHEMLTPFRSISTQHGTNRSTPSIGFTGSSTAAS